MTGSCIWIGGGGGGGGDPGEVFLLLLAVVEPEELDPVVDLRFLRHGRFTKSRTAMRRRMVAITAAAMMPPWIMLVVEELVDW